MSLQDGAEIEGENHIVLAPQRWIHCWLGYFDDMEISVVGEDGTAIATLTGCRGGGNPAPDDRERLPTGRYLDPVAHSTNLASSFPLGVATARQLVALGFNERTVYTRCLPGGPWRRLLQTPEKPHPRPQPP